MKKSIILMTILCLIFLSQGYSSDGQGTALISGDTGLLPKVEMSIGFATGASTGDQGWVRIWGNVGTVVLGYDPAEQKPLVYATELSSGDIYQFLGQWRKIGGPGSMFVADHAGHLYGLATDKSAVYEYSGTPGKWTKVGGAAESIYAGSTRLYATNPQTGDIYEYIRELGSWRKAGGPGSMFVTDHTGHLYGLATDKSAVYEYSGTPGKWEKVGGAATSIYAGGDNLYAGSPDTGNIHEYSRESGKWSNIGKPDGVVLAVDFRGRLFGISSAGNEVYLYERTGGRKMIGGPAAKIFPAIDMLYALDASQELYAIKAPTHFPSISVDDSHTTKPPIVSKPPIKQAGGYTKAIPLPSGPPPKLNPSEYYKISSKANGQVLYVNYGEKEGDPVSIEKSHAGDSQRWKFIPVGEDGYFRIRSKRGGQSLTAHDAGDEWGVLIVVSEWQNSDNQMWKLASVGDGYYAILSKVDDKCLDVTSKKTHYFRPSSYLGSDNQQWKFKIPSHEVCETAEVRIESIYIAKADDFGAFGEAGDHAEWRLKIEINDREWHWSDEYVKDGMTVERDWNCYVDLPDDTATIRIAASGIEKDSVGDDQLPAAVSTHNSTGNWGIGQTRELVGKSKDFHYIITYSIWCAK